MHGPRPIVTTVPFGKLVVFPEVGAGAVDFLGVVDGLSPAFVEFGGLASGRGRAAPTGAMGSTLEIEVGALILDEIVDRGATGDVTPGDDGGAGVGVVGGVGVGGPDEGGLSTRTGTGSLENCWPFTVTTATSE